MEGGGHGRTSKGTEGKGKEEGKKRRQEGTKLNERDAEGFGKRKTRCVEWESTTWARRDERRRGGSVRLSWR